MTLTGEKRLINKEICPNTTLPNRNPTKPSLSSNQGIFGDKPATSRLKCRRVRDGYVNSLSPELNPICYLLALLAHHFLHLSRI